MTKRIGGSPLVTAKFHFVGIGGIGMCGLAELLHNIGAKVTGSDLGENANTDHLKALGIRIFKGHQASNVQDVDVLVFSSAVKSDNPEVKAARERHIPVIPRAEALAEIMRLHRGIAVAGTHGKTTTTSMTAAIFLASEMQPTIIVGGRLDLIQSTALLGQGDWLIAEADESDGSFNRLSPEIAIITNIDSDHLDHYKTFENLKKAFWAFASKVPFYGSVIACGDDPTVREVFKDFPKRIYFYGFNADNDFVISGERGEYTLQQKQKALGAFSVRVPGKHNALNATASIIAGMQAGISFADCAMGLLRFQGVDRRFHFKGEEGGVMVYDDYGHHPTEVRATLQGFKEKFPDRRLVVFFQPHRYSRTQLCWDDFKVCFTQSDVLLLTDIYPAGEAAIAGVDSRTLSQQVDKPSAVYIGKSAQLGEQVFKHLRSGDLFLTLGAGDGWKVGVEVLGLLKQG